MEKLLTITVPTYNVESYLSKCLDSFLLKEDSELLEVLIVNDGSTDSSADIAKTYVSKYPNVFRLINKENGGHGSTINEGIKAATGKYFKVVDSDDWVDKDAMKNLIECLKASDSDLVYSNYYWVDNKTGKKSVEFEKPFSSVEYKKEYVFDEIKEPLFLKMHGYNIKTEILKNIPLIDEHCFYVDMEFVMFPIPFVKTITFIEDFVYQYRIGLPGQSMDPVKMQRNAANFDRVTDRLFNYYIEQQEKISDRKVEYMEHLLGRLVASRMKIYLSNPYSTVIKEQMKAYDKMIKDKYPNVYNAVGNKAVIALRKTGYNLYGVARLTYFMKERLS